MSFATLSMRPTPRLLERPDPSPERFYAPADRVLTADPSRREDVRFDSDGLSLAGHFYRPPGAGAADHTAAIAMCGPSSSVKEQTLPHYAQRFADAGYTVLTFDPRTFGESEGDPRCYYDPAQIIGDYANAVSYLIGRDDIDGDRIALVGLCMGAATRSRPRRETSASPP